MNCSFDDKRWNASVLSLARGASIASQTRPTPARIVFRILKTIHAGVGWVWLARLCERLPRLPIHLGASTGEQLLCQSEKCNCADLFVVVGYFRLFRDEREVLASFFWSCFQTPLFIAWDSQGHCQWGTSSEKEPLQNVAGPNLSTCIQHGKFCDTLVNHENKRSSTSRK